MVRIILVLCIMLAGCSRCLECENAQGDTYGICREDVPRNETLADVEDRLNAQGYYCE